MKTNLKLFRFLTAVLVGVCCCAVPAAALSSEPAAWAAQQVETVEKAGLLAGTSPGFQSPTAPINRGCFCQILFNLIQLEGIPERLEAVSPASPDYFSDISPESAQYYPQLYYAVAYGITEGSLRDGKRVTDSNENLTREQAAKMMCALVDALERYADVAPPQPGAAKTFTDQNSISPWAAPFVERASSLGILQGDAQGRFLPQGTLSWQEACVMVERCYQAAEQAAEQTARLRDQTLGITRLYSQQKIDGLRYSTTRWHLLQNGGLLRFDYDEPITVETFAEDGTVAGTKEIPMELEACNSFYENEDSYFLVFDQHNSEENDSKEVVRIVRYDKNWNRLGAASVTGAEAFAIGLSYSGAATSSFDSRNDVLVFHTERSRYVDNNDGVHHQSNFTVKVRISDMTVLECSERFPSNHVSHTFGQYVQFDPSTGFPVYADHGDAYPRGFALNVENSTGESSQLNFFSFPGATGDNTTKAIPGGLGIASDSYLFAGASAPQIYDENLSLTDANAFLAVVPKDGYPDCEPAIKWLTQYPAGGDTYVSEIYLVPVNNNTFVVMWNSRGKDEQKDEFQFSYAVFDGQGNQIGSTVTKEGFETPELPPVVSGNQIRWAGTQRGGGRCVNVYSLDITPNAVTTAASYQLVIEPASISMGVGESLDLSAAVVGSDGSRTPVEAEFDTSARKIAYIDFFNSDNTLLAQEEGETTLTATCLWRGQALTATAPVSVYQGEIKIIVEPKEVVMHVGETFQLDVSVTGLRPGSFPQVHYYYNRNDGLGISISSTGEITALKPCTKRVSISIEGSRESRPEPVVITVTVLP